MNLLIDNWIPCTPAKRGESPNHKSAIAILQ